MQSTTAESPPAVVPDRAASNNTVINRPTTSATATDCTEYQLCGSAEDRVLATNTPVSASRAEHQSVTSQLTDHTTCDHNANATLPVSVDTPQAISRDPAVNNCLAVAGGDDQGTEEQEEASGGCCGRADHKCTICLKDVVDKALVDSCLHAFCFVCLLEWAKVKAECPLCRQPFSSVMRKVNTEDTDDADDADGEFEHHVNSQQNASLGIAFPGQLDNSLNNNNNNNNAGHGESTNSRSVPIEVEYMPSSRSRLFDPRRHVNIPHWFGLATSENRFQDDGARGIPIRSEFFPVINGMRGGNSLRLCYSCEWGGMVCDVFDVGGRAFCRARYKQVSRDRPRLA